MPYRIAGIDVHKKMLAVVVSDVSQCPRTRIRGPLQGEAIARIAKA